MTPERAVFAGGCFWGMQDLIRKLPGVTATKVGYTGGDVPNATYRNHGTHAEGIEIIFDPDQITFRRLLEFFFQIHDPTTAMRQGNDRGSSYRSAIYYGDPSQKAEAENAIADVDASGLWPGKVVTEVTTAGDFWEAEPEHQDYLERIPHGYTWNGYRTAIPVILSGPTGFCQNAKPPNKPTVEQKKLPATHSGVAEWSAHLAATQHRKETRCNLEHVIQPRRNSASPDGSTKPGKIALRSGCLIWATAPR